VKLSQNPAVMSKQKVRVLELFHLGAVGDGSCAGADTGGISVAGAGADGAVTAPAGF
jgi:hypothetical protein